MRASFPAIPQAFLAVSTCRSSTIIKRMIASEIDFTETPLPPPDYLTKYSSKKTAYLLKTQKTEFGTFNGRKLSLNLRS